MEFDAVSLEYQALRAEIVSRIETRSQTIFGVVTLAGVLYSFGLNNPAVAFVYPIVSLFIIVGWVQNDISIKLAGKYIRDEIEPQIPGLGWQAWRAGDAADSTVVLGIRLTSIAAAGVFIVTQIVALFIGFSRPGGLNDADWPVAAVSIICTALTGLLLTQYYVRRINRLTS